MDFGVKTTRGLRTSRSAWRRSRWKNCAGVVGIATVMLSRADCSRNRSIRALECSGPWPSVPWGSSSTSPLVCAHFSSPATRNWSMITCASLKKSPNCASHSTSVSLAVTEYPYSNPSAPNSFRGES